MSYQNLEVWKLSNELTLPIHNMSVALPNFEKFEEGSQIRRSIKSVRSNIVEGYGRRMYKNEYIRFLNYALASNYETIDHLDILFETASLKDVVLYKEIRSKLEILGKKLTNFLKVLNSSYSKPLAFTESVPIEPQIIETQSNAPQS